MRRISGYRLTLRLVLQHRVTGPSSVSSSPVVATPASRVLEQIATATQASHLQDSWFGKSASSAPHHPRGDACAAIRTAPSAWSSSHRSPGTRLLLPIDPEP